MTNKTLQIGDEELATFGKDFPGDLTDLLDLYFENRQNGVSACEGSPLLDESGSKNAYGYGVLLHEMFTSEVIEIKGKLAKELPLQFGFEHLVNYIGENFKIEGYSPSNPEIFKA